MPEHYRKPPTIVDIARMAGVSKSTVSRAMKGSPQIGERTKTRIRSICRRTGYRPNMVFSIMGSGNRLKGSKSNLLPIAYLYDMGKASAPESSMEYTYLLDAARNYGYFIDAYDLEKFTSARKLEKILYSNGYCGVIIGRIMIGKSLAYELDLGKFTVIFNTNTSWKHEYHRVVGDVYEAVNLAWDKTVEAGYRRIGAAPCKHSPPLPDDELRLAAVLQRQNRDSSLVEKIPTFSGSPDDSDSFIAWIRKFRPDAVIGLHIGHYYVMKDSMRCKMPGQIGFSCLLVNPEDRWQKDVSGIITQERDISITTISILDQEIRKRIHGIPEQILSVHIEPKWVEGRTLGVKAQLSGGGKAD